MDSNEKTTTQNIPNKQKNQGLGCAIAILIIIVLIFVPFIFNTIKESTETSSKLKLEERLINEGKVVSADTVINNIANILKDRKENELNEYIAEEFSYIDNNRNESKYIYNFWRDLGHLVSSYDIEKRGNSIKNKETYVIYWNVVEENKNLHRADINYCLQKIMINLNRITKQNEITYEIEKIMITDN